MKRKPLKYMEQRRLVHFHTHQKRFGDMMEKRHFVSLPDPVPLTDPGMATIAPDAPAQLDTPNAIASKLPGNNVTTQSQDMAVRPTGPSGGNPVTSNAAPKHALTTTMHAVNVGPRQTMLRPQQPQQPGVWPRTVHANLPNSQQMQYTLRRIQKEHLERQTNVGPYQTMPRPAAYANSMMSQMHMHRPNQVGAYNPGISQMQRSQRMPVHMQMTPEQRQLYIQRLRMRQQQQQAQAQAAAAAQMMGAPQYNPQYQQQMGHPQMVQPAPQMQVQQPLQHGYNQQMMVRQQFPQQPNAPMNQIQRPMY